MNREGKNSQKNTTPEGRYANYFKIGYNAFEFVIDFGQFYDEDEEAQLQIRIVTSPFYAKRLLTTLQGGIEQYEQTFGLIQEE